MSSTPTAKPRSCYKCGYFAETLDKTCPICSRQLHTTTETRVRGGLMAACGLVILATIGSVTSWMISVIANPTPGGARFNGTTQEKYAFFGLFAMLLAFGAVAVLIGGWQMVAGRRNRIVSWIAIGFALLIFIVAGAIIATV